MKQEISLLIALGCFLFAVGYIDKAPAVSLLLILAMMIPIAVGKLDKRRLTARDIERRYGRK